MPSDRLRFIVDGFCGGEYAGIIDRKGEVDVSKYTECMGFTRVHLDAIAAELNTKYEALTEQPDATAPAIPRPDCELLSSPESLLAFDDELNPEPGEPARELPPAAPYKGPIKQPCSACSAGDTAMEHHDHEYVKLEFRGAAPAASPAQVLSEEQVRQAMKEVQTGEHYYARLTEKLNALLRSPASTSGKEMLCEFHDKPKQFCGTCATELAAPHHLALEHVEKICEALAAYKTELIALSSKQKGSARNRTRRLVLRISKLYDLAAAKESRDGH